MCNQHHLRPDFIKKEDTPPTLPILEPTFKKKETIIWMEEKALVLAERGFKKGKMEEDVCVC